MSSITPNYTVVGNPTITEDYILTNTSADDYVTFNEAGIIDTDKRIEIVFRLKINTSDGYSGILSIGDIHDQSNLISIMSDYGSIYCNFGYNGAYLSIQNMQYGEYYWYKFIYDPHEYMTYSYYSEDGENWNEYEEQPLYNGQIYIGIANNIIGISTGYTKAYLKENRASLDLTNLEIWLDGEKWYSTFEQHFDPVVKVQALYVDSKTYSGNKKITSINCNNATFVNNSMAGAFANCTNLTSVTNINQDVTNMSYAFAGLSDDFYEYNFPTIPNSVTDISGLFAYHTNWWEIPAELILNTWNKLPAHLQNSAAGFLDGCTYLYNIPENTIPNFITNISNGFRGCKSFSNMPIITENITDMSGAFEGCTSMYNASYTIPNSVVNIARAFKKSSINTTPGFASGTNIDDMSEAFSGCNSLTTITNFPASANNMSGTFNYCYILNTVPTLPANVTNMSYCFNGCSNLTTSPSIPSTVINMHRTFNYCPKLTSAPTLPANVQDISNCFYYCTNMTANITIPQNVTNMYGTFGWCNKLTNAIITSNNITNMAYAFYYCNYLQSIGTLPNSVVDLSHAFYGCYNLKGTFVIPNTVNNLSYAFYGCYNITSTPDISNVTLTNSLYYTFCSCRNIKTPPTIPTQITNLAGTFSSCYNLTTPPTIPTNITDMSSTFAYCYNLTSVPESLPSNIANIRGCFMYCRNVTSNFPQIPEGLTDMSVVFAGCNKHTSFPTLPNSTTQMYGTYRYCSNLTQAPEIKQNVTNIGDVYQGCYNVITSPVIPANVTNMCNSFYNCRNLTGPIYIKANSVENITNCFYNTSNWKNVYIHMYNTEPVTKILYGWNAVYGDPGKIFYTDQDYYNTASSEYYGSVPIYYANGTRMYNTTGEVYTYGETMLYVNENNENYYECMSDPSEEKEVIVPAGSHTDIYDLFEGEYGGIANGTIVGSLTNTNGILSNFSSSNYLKHSGFLLSSPDFEIVFKFKNNSTASPTWNPIFDSIVRNSGNGLLIWTSQYYTDIISAACEMQINSTQYHVHTPSNFNVLPNTWYYIKVKLTSSELQLTISENEDFSDSVTVSTATNGNYYSTNSDMWFGKEQLWGSSYYFDGYLDMNKSYIKVNNKLWWKGTTYSNGITLKDIDEENKNFEVIGQLTNTNEIYSDFSDNNYIKVNGDFYSAVSNGAPWEMHVKIITGTLGSRRKIIASGAGDNHWLGIESSKVWRVRLRAQTTTNYLWDFTGTTILTDNTLYYAKLCFDGSKYSLYYSTDNENWTLEGSKNSTDIIGNVSSLTTIGIGLTDNTSYHNPFNGSIDLNECYIKVNNEYWWKAYESWKEPNIIPLNPSLCSITNTMFKGAGVIRIPIVFSPGNKSWEICLYAKKSAWGSNQYTDLLEVKEVSFDNTNHKCITLEDNQLSGTMSVGGYFSTTGTSWDYAGSSYRASIPFNTYYYYKVGWTGTQLYYKVSSDGSTWTDIYTGNCTTPLHGLNTNTFIINIAKGQDVVWELDLSKCYVKIDGQDWWKFKYITKEDI